MRHRSIIGVLLSLGVIGTALAIDPHSTADPTGPPNQSCQAPAPASPGHASTSPGPPFNEPGSGGNPSNLGGTGGLHFAAKSQYDVSCFQTAQH